MKRFSWILGSLFVVPLFAHDIITTKLTYRRDIAPIINRRCISCHSSGSTIPLTSYDEVRPWAVAIKEQVLSRSMPPWGAVKGFGDVLPDNSLTEEQITIMAAWVVGGAPQGKPGLLQEQKPLPPASHGQRLSDALLVPTTRVLRSPLLVWGIRPNPSTFVTSVRITAHLPDGEIEPLLWLYEYDPKLQRVFSFSKPLRLPRGTRIESTAPLQFYLESAAKAPSPER